MKQPKGLQNISAICGLIQLGITCLAFVLFCWAMISLYPFALMTSLWFLIFAQAFDSGKRYCIMYEGEEML